MPAGTVFMVAVKDEASAKLSEPVKQFFAKLGSIEILALGMRDAWAFVGVKGQKAFVEKRGEAVGTGAILGYAKEVKKTRKTTKVTGGSKIEVHSAGFTDGPPQSAGSARILVNDKEVLTE